VKEERVFKPSWVSTSKCETIGYVVGTYNI